MKLHVLLPQKKSCYSVPISVGITDQSEHHMSPKGNATENKKKNRPTHQPRTTMMRTDASVEELLVEELGLLLGSSDTRHCGDGRLWVAREDGWGLSGCLI